jgi:site-specific DNA recombinase
MSRNQERQTNATDQRPSAVRCAIYTRKSTDDGLDQEFNSLDAQRESAEAFIKSQASEGWTCLPEKYDDGGFTGGNMDRPALKRLLFDIEAGKIDCVVVYKVDRLSRSLLDFARMMEVFDRRGVSFVSVTQHFNTTHSMGRLTLNILLSFAQFEREIISERIRDKIAAQRRKGKWSGGRPVLGYDVNRSEPSPKLVVNSLEAPRVRKIFTLYLQQGSLLPVVKELRRLGWINKAWRSQRGRAYGGRPFDKCSLHALLTNPLYAGRIRHKDATYAGEHEALVDEATWNAVQNRLRENGRNGGAAVRNRHTALLRGLLHCKACGRAMVHTFTEKRGRCYRYYTCTRAIKDGFDQCAAPSLPAAEIERVVMDQIRRIAQDQRLLTDVLRQVERMVSEGHEAQATERRQGEGELRRCEAEIRRLSREPGQRQAIHRVVELQERVRLVEERLRDMQATHGAAPRFDAAEITALFTDFDAVWTQLTPRERVQLVELLVARVEYDGARSEVAVSFHETGLASFNGTRSNA